MVHEDPLGDQDAPHPVLLREFDLAEVTVSNVTSKEWGFDGVVVSVGYECALPHSMPVTNRTTRFTFTMGNETVQQGVWMRTLDGCSHGQSTGIPVGEDCLITGIFVEATWERQDGVQVFDRAPDRGGLTFNACSKQTADAEDREGSTITAYRHAAVESADPEGEMTATGRQAPAGAWLCLVAIAVVARQRC